MLEPVELDDRYLDIPCMGWADLTSFGVDQRQLRNTMDRGLIKLGRKRQGRLLFSLRERFMVDLFASLTATWVPVSVASITAQKVSLELSTLLECLKYSASNDGDMPEIYLFTASDSADVAIGYEVDGDPGPLRDGNIPIASGRLPASVCISMNFLLRRFLSFAIEVQGRNEGEDE